MSYKIHRMRERSLSLTPLSEPVSPERTQGGSPLSPFPPAHSQASSLHEESDTDDEDENQKPRGKNMSKYTVCLE